MWWQDNSCDCGLFLLTYLDFFTHSLPADISKSNLDQQHGAAFAVDADPCLLLDQSFLAMIEGPSTQLRPVEYIYWFKRVAGPTERHP